MVWDCSAPFAWRREATERVHRWAFLVALASPLLGLAILIAAIGTS